MSIAKNRIIMRFFIFLIRVSIGCPHVPHYFYCIEIRKRRFARRSFLRISTVCALFLRVTIVTLFSRYVKRLFLFLSVLWYTLRRGATKILYTALCSVTSYLGRLRRALCCATFRCSALCAALGGLFFALPHNRKFYAIIVSNCPIDRYRL